MVEKAGVGTVRMIEECIDIGVPATKFELYSGGFAVVFKFAELISVSVKKHNAKHELSKRQKEILDIIKKYGEINIKQIMVELENPPSRTMITRNAVWVLKNKL